MAGSHLKHARLKQVMEQMWFSSVRRMELKYMYTHTHTHTHERRAKYICLLNRANFQLSLKGIRQVVVRRV